MAAGGLLPVTAAAQDFSTPITPILIIDSDAILRDTVAGQRVSSELQDKISALASENRRIEADLAAEERDLTAKRPEMEPAAFRSLADAFDAKVQNIRDEQDAKQRELQRAQEAEQQGFINSIAPILSEIGNRYGAVVILERRNVVLAADGIDITEEAIARINEQLGQKDDAPAEVPPTSDGGASDGGETGQP